MADVFKGQWTGNYFYDVEEIDCNVCGASKSHDHFHKDKTSRTGTVLTCKPCRIEVTKAWQAANPEKDKLRQKRMTLRAKAKRVLAKKRENARLCEEYLNEQCGGSRA